MLYRFLVLLVVLVACSSVEEPTTYIVQLQVDGSELVYQQAEPVTVGEFLDQVGVELDPLDRVNPDQWTQIYDEMRITVVRVEQDEFCEDVEIAFRQETQLREDLAPGEEFVGRQGRNGIEQVCYRVRIENGVEVERLETRRVMTLDPVNEVIYVGPSTELDPVPIVGTLAYINNDNAWIIRGSSTRKRLLTTSQDLDRRVFSLSEDSRQLLFTRQTDDSATFNQLALIPDTIANTPMVVNLIPQDVLYAEWIPNRRNTFSYSTAESRDTAPGWHAFNDLWVMTIDPDTGEQTRIEEIIEPSSGGIYGWWGTNYKWSPDGTRLAWIRADSVGLVDLDNGELGEPLLEYPEYSSLQNWSWRTTVSWSPDGSLIASTVHGPPYGDEDPEFSPIFNVAVASTVGDFAVDLNERTGIWSTPRFSPEIRRDDSEFPTGYIAYLQAREWDSSVSSEYDLVIADRDGSNARIIFPEPGQPGLRAEQFAQDFAWSPDGQQIALIYLGNLWIVDVDTGTADQITQDGNTSRPVWGQ